MRDVQALPRGAAQAVRHLRPFRRGQHDRVPGAGERLAGQGGEQLGGILLGHRAHLGGQALAEVPDQVGFGPGWLGGLHGGDRFLDEALRLRLGQRHVKRVRCVGPVGWRAGWFGGTGAHHRLG